jgi:nitrite reductase (NO-forming)
MRKTSFLLLLVVSLLLAGCGAANAEAASTGSHAADRTYVLRTGRSDGRMFFVGDGGAIQGQPNPDLSAAPGESIEIVLINGDGMSHDLEVAGLGAKSALLMGIGKTVRLTVTLPEDAAGAYAYFCTVAGHRQAGMEGRIVVVGGAG